MESIESGELFGNVEARAGQPPAHVPVDHIRCAFYPGREVDAPWAYDAEGNPLGPMVCPHGIEANGAFYSEDLIRLLRVAVQHGRLDYARELLEPQYG